MKYYWVKAFFIEKEDIWITSRDIAEVSEQKTVTFLATKTIGGYKEVKTGRVIPTVGLHMHTSTRSPYSQCDNVRLDTGSVSELNKTGAILVTSPYYEEKLISPVQSTEVNAVSEYLKGDVAKETFEKLDEIKKKGIIETKENHKRTIERRRKEAKEILKELKEEARAKAKARKEAKELNGKIKKAVDENNKESKNGRKK